MATERMARLGAANMAKMMGLLCVADSKLGRLGEGERPTTKAGDYSDVVVVDAEGRIIPWQRKWLASMPPRWSECGVKSSTSCSRFS